MFNFNNYSRLLFSNYSCFVDSKVYCLRTNSESFEAQCLKNEVIVMTKAVYGRTRIGKCLEDEDPDFSSTLLKDSRFLGCSVDVLSLFDERCSGRVECKVRGTDDELRSKKPCQIIPQMSFLEADYFCAPCKSCF